MGLGYKYLRGKSQCRPRKGQRGLMETGMTPETATTRPGQCICHFPTRIGRHAKVIPGRTAVYRRGTEGPIPIGLTVLQEY
jgi:hypothetical protein